MVGFSKVGYILSMMETDKELESLSCSYNYVHADFTFNRNFDHPLQMSKIK